MKKSIIELTEKEIDNVSGGEWLQVLKETGKIVLVISLQITMFAIAIGIITCLSVKRKKKALKE